MTLRLRIWIALLPVLALVVVVAVVADSAEASPLRFPPGAYTATITDADYPPGFPEEGKAPGTFTNEFTADGLLIVTHEGFEEVLVEARYISNPARLVITSETGPFACSNFQSNVKAVYDWTFDGSELTLSVVHDACGPRAVILTAHPWVLQP